MINLEIDKTGKELPKLKRFIVGSTPAERLKSLEMAIDKLNKLKKTF